MSRAALVIALVVGCASNKAKPPDPDVEDRMLDHFFAVTALERAVVHGNLAAAGKHARALAAPRTGDPESWAPHVATLQAKANAVGQVADLAAAAHGITEILRVCHGCHDKLGVDFETVSIPEPPPGDTIAGKMRRHQWGVDLMRVSLVFGDDAIWERSTSVLTSAPLDPAELAESGVINPETIGHARTLRQLSGSAKFREGAERFDTYDKLLGTCVGCHAETGERH